MYITAMQRPIDPQLDRLKELLGTMAGDVENAIVIASNAWARLDPSGLSVANELDRKVKKLQVEIDGICFQMIALQNPCASDLRYIIAAVKVNNHLARMAELAVRVVIDTDNYLKVSSDILISDLTRLGQEVVSMVRQATRAFLMSDIGLASVTLSRESEVETMKKEIVDQALARMRVKSTLTEPAVYSVFIAKNLARIATHASKVASGMVFAVSGEYASESQLRTQEQGS